MNERRSADVWMLLLLLSLGGDTIKLILRVRS